MEQDCLDMTSFFFANEIIVSSLLVLISLIYCFCSKAAHRRVKLVSQVIEVELPAQNPSGF
jgi:hypothetical protein